MNGTLAKGNGSDGRARLRDGMRCNWIYLINLVRILPRGAGEFVRELEGRTHRILAPRGGGRPVGTFAEYRQMSLRFTIKVRWSDGWGRSRLSPGFRISVI